LEKEKLRLKSESRLREIPAWALREADVILKVSKQLIGNQGKALGQEVLKRLSPSQQVIKIVHEELITIGEPRVEAALARMSRQRGCVVGCSGCRVPLKRLKGSWSGIVERMGTAMAFYLGYR